MADEEKAKQSLSGVRFGTKHSYDDFGLVVSDFMSCHQIAHIS